MPRIAYAAAAFVLGALTLTACAGTSAGGAAGTKIDAERVASVAEGGGEGGGGDVTGERAFAFMELSLKVTDGCPPLDDTKTGKVLGPDDVPPSPPAPSGDRVPGEAGDRVPLPPGRDSADPASADAPDASAARIPDTELLEPVPLAAPEICFADTFGAHVTTALKGIGPNATEVRAALRRAGYPDGRIVDMEPEGGSPRVRIDLREQDARVALQVVHTGAGGSVVEAFGAQRAAPLKDVRYVP
ncbi:hypothetical protein OHA37_27415 [Streptomyces sp. NBC_00335]|uniref:hypothetical protein n=1 Tax=unclassified Streptomyces TaxID=2593676 RepID=UPI00224D69D9|nr:MULTISPECIES: hypothetical protein [unclassified Streptomyces]MCX5407579.1 hypothetical protein [Streptomyces sp. NBC_00086]